jgi:hypothetical protein
MDVYEAVTSRRAVRGFTDQPVPREVLERGVVRRNLVAVRIQPPTVAHLRADRRAGLRNRITEIAALMRRLERG